MMMLHALRKWSSMLSIHLWPYGLHTANDICNSAPRKGSDISPIKSFSGVTVHPKLKHYHAFGCPMYILNKDLQAQKSLPKWQSRARLGVYLGPSPNHSCSVSLVLNPHTGHMSLQFHVKHDEFFETVDGHHHNYNAPAATWKELSSLTATQYKEAVPSMIKPLREPVESPKGTIDHTSQEDPRMVLLEPTESENLMEETLAAMAPQEEHASPSEQHVEQRQTQSSRVVHNTAHYSEGLEQQGQGIVAWEVLISQDEMEDLPIAQRQYEIQKGMQEPVVYAASVNPDTMNLHEAMKVPNQDQFKKAMDKELQDHIAHRHWEVVPRNEVPKGTRVLDMVWPMRCKRRIDTREVYKWKARLNVHGGQQQ